MTSKTRRGRKLGCSFCGKDQEQAQRLIAGPGVFICDQCVSLCNEILANDPPASAASPCGGTAAHGRMRPASAPWWRRLLGRRRTVLQVGMDV